MRLFKIGDEVEFELSADYWPRWNSNIDRGGSNEWTTGKVVQADFGSFVVEHGNAAAPRLWGWNQPCGDWQKCYSFPGYLRLKGSAKVPESVGVCKCDITQLWNYGHNSDCPERRRA